MLTRLKITSVLLIYQLEGSGRTVLKWPEKVLLRLVKKGNVAMLPSLHGKKTDICCQPKLRPVIKLVICSLDTCTHDYYSMVRFNGHFLYIAI
jgi:hypothetical protein